MLPKQCVMLLFSLFAMMALSSLYADDPAKPDVKDQKASPNLLSNPSLEEGEGETPKHWTHGSKIDGVEYFWDRKTAHEGKASVGFHKTAKRYFPIAQWHQVIERPGESPSLRVTVQVKAEGLTKAILDVVFLDEGGDSFGHAWVAYIGEADGGQPITHDWKEYQGVVAIPKEAKRLMIGLQIYGPGKVWFDDVTATASDLPPTDPVKDAKVGAKPPEPKVVPSPNPSDFPQSNISVAVRKDQVDDIVKFIKAEFGSQVPVETRDLSADTSVLTVSGSTNLTQRVGDFIRGLVRQSTLAASAKPVADEQDIALDRESKLLANRVRAATGVEREKLKQELERLAERHFLHRQKRRKQEIDDLANRVDQMRVLHHRRQENQAEILKRRVKELLDEDRDLKWDDAKRDPLSKPGASKSEVAERVGM